MAIRRDERPEARRSAPPVRGARPVTTTRPAPATARPATPAGANKTTPVRFNEPEGRKMSKKEKKIAKKVAKFDEMDLRNYPMTVGKWIGTYIILAIPLVNVIACICWFFGAGNKSRAAWIRSHVVRFLIIILLIAAIIGGGWLVLKNMASKNAGAETTNEVLYYAVDQVANIVDDINPDMAYMLRAIVAEKLGMPAPEPPARDNDGNGDENGGYSEDFGGEDGGDLGGEYE